MKDVTYQFKQIKNAFFNNISYHINYPLIKPETVSFLLTYDCCLKCKMCRPPKQYLSSKQGELKIDDWKKIIDQLKFWNIKNLLISGGEPLLKKEDSLEIVKYASSLGLNTTIVTNAFLWNKKICQEFFDAGLTNFTTSLDGAKKETHDRIRGIKGSYEKVVNTLKVFNQLKKNKPSFSLNCTTVIMKDNFRELINIYHLLRKVGVTNIMYQAISGDYPQLMPNDKEIEELKDVVSELINLKRKEGFISTDEDYFRLLPKYYEEKQKNGLFKIGKCIATYNNLMISPDGTVDICGYGPYNISLKNNSLSKFWKSKEFKECRKRVKKCNKQCMYLCYKKVDFKSILSKFRIK